MTIQAICDQILEWLETHDEWTSELNTLGENAPCEESVDAAMRRLRRVGWYAQRRAATITVSKR